MGPDNYSGLVIRLPVTISTDETERTKPTLAEFHSFIFKKAAQLKKVRRKQNKFHCTR